ncbi:hypothetical protein QMX33_003314 [Yersinia ruckeri]|nr:hypothetical protein [Yersinia ruckeri]EKN4202115.1 hypothetical protein [Yersinia ruckeri]EKN4726591.1 hypothetical protein [Yersinia ruckeri]ELV7522099.1 hypothetical protein [Yersinia ruckeri]
MAEGKINPGTLLIKIPIDRPEYMDWLFQYQRQELVEYKNGTIHSQLELLELIRDLRVGWDVRIIILISSRKILFHTFEFNFKKIINSTDVIKYALEDYTATDIDDMEVSVINYDDGLYSIAAINKDVIKYWLRWFYELDINPDFVFPDVLCLPYLKDQWSAIELEGNLLVRTGKCSGFSIDKEDLGKIKNIIESNINLNDLDGFVYNDLVSCERLCTYSAMLLFSNNFDIKHSIISKTRQGNSLYVFKRGVFKLGMINVLLLSFSFFILLTTSSKLYSIYYKSINYDELVELTNQTIVNAKNLIPLESKEFSSLNDAYVLMKDKYYNHDFFFCLSNLNIKGKIKSFKYDFENKIMAIKYIDDLDYLYESEVTSCGELG